VIDISIFLVILIKWYVYHSDLSRYVSDYCISVTKKSDTSITVICYTMSLTTVVIDVSLFLVILIQYSQRHSVTNHCDRRITLLSDTDSVQFYTPQASDYRLISKTVIIHFGNLDISFVLLNIFSKFLLQWFIMLCLWLYCSSITKMSDTSITVIYHGMSLTVL
jgi:hypothetical protein